MNFEQYEELSAQIYALRITLMTLITALDHHKTPFTANLLYSHMDKLRDALDQSADSASRAKLLDEFESLLDEIGSISDS